MRRYPSLASVLLAGAVAAACGSEGPTTPEVSLLAVPRGPVRVSMNPGWDYCGPGGGQVLMIVHEGPSNLDIIAQLKGVRPNTEYTIGLTDFRNAPAFGDLPFRNEASYSGVRDCDSGIRGSGSRTAFTLATVVTDDFGNASYRVSLSVASGVYEIQFGVVRAATGGMTYYKSGDAYASTVTVTIP
jgi:hypothetical protein